jgi:hypothetical protein
MAVDNDKDVPKSSACDEAGRHSTVVKEDFILTSVHIDITTSEAVFGPAGEPFSGNHGELDSLDAL